MSDCANSRMEPYEGVHGGIWWDDGTVTPLAYASYANNRERKVKRIELDGVNYEPAGDCENAAKDGFRCSSCGESWLGGFNLGPIAFKRCPSCGARVRSGEQ